MQGCYMVYSQNIYIVTLETESDSHKYLVGMDIYGTLTHKWTRTLIKFISSYKTQTFSSVRVLSDFQTVMISTAEINKPAN